MNYTKENHTFVVCAYKEVPFLDNCIQSLMNQTINSRIIISTSTPNQFIKDIANKYNLPLFVNEGAKGITNDWNYAYGLTETDLVTIVHQDDIYEPQYLEFILDGINSSKEPIMAYTKYYEIRNMKKVTNNKLLYVKNIMNYPLKFKWCRKSIFVRRRILSVGCSICCSSVTLVKSNIPQPLFSSDFCASPDWEAWERISKIKGDIIYIQKPLLGHTIAGYSETTATVLNNSRSREEMIMLCRFWPKPIAKFIHKFYSKAQLSNNL